MNGTSIGLGLKQVLEGFISEEDRFTIVIDKIISQADTDLVTPEGTLKQKRFDLEKNSRITQSRAFVALATYILEKNGYTEQETEAKLGANHDQALQKLKDALLNPPGGNHMALDLVTDDSWDQIQNALNIAVNFSDLDPVKQPKSLANMARAIDLYLALENAYKYYADNGMESHDHYYGEQPSETPLLSKQQRKNLLEHFGRNLKGFYKFNKLELGDVTSVMEGGTGILKGLLNQISSVADLSVNELQPGNWSYKNFLAIGYASLGMNTTSGDESSYKNYFNTAYRTSFLFKTQDRTKYWSYQTDNGKHFWAEGPFYLHFTLREVIPFWHAVRGNGFYSNGQISYNGLSVQDPFFNSDFTNPLNWLADIVTPDGRIPPLDDGNKNEMKISSVLRWNSNYGKGIIGRKFAAIADKNTSYGFSRNLYLVELAVPRNGVMPKEPSTAQGGEIGDDPGVQPGPNTNQQTVVRRDYGNETFYMLMNGENGDAIVRGESHEQPDQLQLLLYQGDHSYLMDSGYDNSSFGNSSWNDIRFHNVLSYEGGNGGLTPPYKGWRENDYVGHDIPGDIKARYVSDHNSVFYNTVKNVNKLTILSGSILLNYLTWPGLNSTNYKRKVILVNSQQSPYVIDLNTAQKNTGEDKNLVLNYHGKGDYHAVGSPSYPGVDRDAEKWHYWHDSQNTNKKLYMYANTVEFKQQHTWFEDDPATDPQVTPKANYYEEKDDKSEKSVHIKIYNNGKNNFNGVTFFKIAEEDPEYKPRRIFSYNSSGTTPHQGWYWKQDANTVDVIVKRSKINMTKYNQTLDFTVNENGVFIPNIRLAGGKDYGFARFKKNSNGVWKIDSDYRVNLEQKAQVFATNTTINASDFSKNIIYVTAGNRLTVGGGTVSGIDQFNMGNNAELLFTANASVNLNGTNFNKIQGGGRYHWVKIQGSAECSNCWFTNGKYNLVVNSGSHEVDLINCSLNNAKKYGLWAQSGNVLVKGAKIKGNNSHGVYSSGDVIVNINRKGSGSSFDPTKIVNNSGSGIYMTGTSQVFLGYSRVYNNGAYNQIWSDNSTYLSAGSNIGYDLQPGYNRLLAGNGRAIYSNNIFEVPASHNYWGGSKPSSSALYGPIGYEPWFEGDPSIPNNDPGPLHYEDSGDGGGGGGGPGDGSDPPVQEIENSTVEVVEGKNSQSTSKRSAKKFTKAIKNRLKYLYKQIRKDPNKIENTRYIKESARLIGLLRRKGEKNMRIGYVRKLNNWRASFESKNGMEARHLSDASLLAQLFTKLDGESYDEFQDLINRSNLRELSPKDRIEVSFLRAHVAERQGNFAQAIKFYEKIESINVEYSNASQQLDLAAVKAALEDSILVSGPGYKSGISSDYKSISTEQPKEFSVNPAYPNPFNPSTIVPFNVPSQAQVKIEVYDIIGQRVAVLTDQTYNQGAYKVRFNANQLSSGVYFIRTEMNNKIFNQKVTLIK